MSNRGAFHRPPREFPAPIGDDEFVVAAPPANSRRAGGTWIQALLSVVGSLGIVVFAFLSPNKLFLIVSVAFVGISLVSAVMSSAYQRHSGKVSAKQARRLYREHLVARGRDLEAIRSRQREIDERLYPAPTRLPGFVAHRRYLWERRANDADFLSFRLGEAAVPLAKPIKLARSDDPMVEYEPGLLKEANGLLDAYRSVAGLSVVESLRDVATMTVGGPRSQTVPLVRSLLTQAASFRAPGDLRLAVIFSGADNDDWAWTKWLPHTRVATSSLNAAPGASAPALLLADTSESVLALLSDQVQPRLDQLRRIQAASGDGQRATLDAPELILVFDSYDAGSPLATAPLMREALANGATLRVHTICIVDPRDSEPPEAQLRVAINDEGMASVQRTGPAGYRIAPVNVDHVTFGNAERIARDLAPLHLEDRTATIDLAEEIRLASVLEPPAGSLCAPIGVTADGARLILDLKQAADGGMGPHGLIVGATGSGKSELLRTLVAGLAVNHTTSELNFVFVDFKGGAAFAELSELPHTAGMITNLQEDLTLVDRMYQALFGEISRRQSLLRAAGNIDDVGSYQKRWRPNGGLPPLPHLLLIVDEFSELLANRPEFIDLFLTVGRVGRSLGIHLLLSSQRLEEGRLKGLEGHLRYRLALRTYSAQESKTVLGSADAFLLPPYPGIGYLAVDTDIYVRFKSALVTAPHDVVRADSQAPVLANFKLHHADSARTVSQTHADDDGATVETDLGVIVAEQRARPENRMPAHQVWLAPLAPELPLGELLAAQSSWYLTGASPASGLSACVGRVDRPAEQRQDPLTLDLSGGGGHLAIVGAPQTGKSTALRTLLMSLMCSYTPDQLRIYGLDFGGGLLRALGDAPHVGSIAGKADAELLGATIHEIRRLVASREARFRGDGVDSMAEARQRGRRGELPAEVAADVLLVIDNWAAVLRDYEQLLDPLTEIATTGLNVGVHLIATAGRWAELRQNIRDSFGTRLELRLNDPIESDFGRKVAEALPVGVPGRALTPDGLQLQFALPRLDQLASTAGLGEEVAKFAASCKERWTGALTPRIRILPQSLPFSAIPQNSASAEIGLEELTLAPARIDFLGEDQHLLVLGDPGSGRTEAIRTTAHAIAAAYPDAEICVVDFRRGLDDLAALPVKFTYATRPPMVAPIVDHLRELCRARLAALDEFTDEETNWSPVFVLVDDYDLLAGIQQNPLSGLADLIFQGRDASIHVVLSRPIANAARALMEPVVARVVESGAPALLLSGDPHEGMILRGQRAQQLPPGRGRIVRRRGNPTLVQLALCERQTVAERELDAPITRITSI